MASSPVLSPKPNPPGSRKVSNDPIAKAKALTFLAKSKAEAKPLSSTPADGGLDLAEQQNEKIGRQYVLGSRLGEGTYAIVYSGHLRHDPSKKFAIKKLKVLPEFKDGINMDAIRELKFLSELNHPNIIKLEAVYSTKDQNICMVLEHLPGGNLEQIYLNHDISYGRADIKAWASQLCQAMWWCHEHRILHRDIKGNNILIAADNTLKLADFGLARSFADPGFRMTYNVITRFYRPPELLYGCHHYGPVVDVWSMGVVIAEVAVREWFLPAHTDIEELALICDLLGNPTEENWSGVTSLQYYTAFTPSNPKRGQPLSWWRQRMPMLGDDGVDLVRGMLTLDPKKRLTSEQVLNHPYWTNIPRPTKKENLPKGGDGEKKMADGLKRPPGEVESGRADKVARKLDFGSMK